MRHDARRPVIALLSSRLGDIGGTETHILQVTEGLRDEFNFYVLALCSDRMRQQLEARGASVVEMPGAGQLDLGSIRRYHRFFTGYHIDIVHTQDARTSITGRIAGRLAGKPVIHTYHISPLHYQTTRLRRILYHIGEALLNLLITDMSVFVSQNTQQLYTRRGLARPQKTRIIRNGVALDDYAPNAQRRAIWRQRLGIHPGTLLLGSVGQLVPLKGYDLLLEAAALLPDTVPGWRLAVAGSGPMHPTLEQIARQKGLEDKVQFLGYVPHEDIPGFLNACDLFVHPSYAETGPYTVMEAQAASLPCIMTEVGDSHFLVPHGVKGFVVPPGDARALTGAIENLLSDADLRMRMIASVREDIGELSIQIMLDKIKNLYQSLL
ncbi:MAG: glycosyltransferase family 4 protein [Anaerolineae bacterium]|nr:glycosyltransferase family 4 protein [Anaerolineae bacterium]